MTRTQRARQYLGIPFAQPPVGALRFAPPVTQPLPSWDEPRNSSYQPACMQDRDRFEDHDKLRLEPKLFPDERIEFSEDCLYLNVFAPDGKNRPRFTHCSTSKHCLYIYSFYQVYKTISLLMKRKQVKMYFVILSQKSLLAGHVEEGSGLVET